MKANKIWGALLATTFGLAAIMAPTNADAEKKKKAETVAAPTGPAQTVKPIQYQPANASIRWGMTIKETAAAIDKMLDLEYKPIYQATSPGIKMKELDHQLEEEKSIFRRSRINFDNLPVALDSTPLKGEYTYRNKESILTLSRKGETRYFFYIQDRLWKIIHEVALDAKSPYGKDFTEAAIKLSTQHGVLGRVTPPNPDKQVFVNVVDWKDETTHLRLVERHEAAAAIIYEELATLNNIDTLRVNKPAATDDIDPAIRAIAREQQEAPAPPPANADKKQEKKK
ncbi:MAG TPA: hypothetical protein PK156_16395 [Polyangium sp.]|nr:hypothetical protein [Polyangium sp.]